jgi:hypothetical protein
MPAAATCRLPRLPSPGLARGPFAETLRCWQESFGILPAHFYKAAADKCRHGSRKIKRFDLTVRQGRGNRRQPADISLLHTEAESTSSAQRQEYLVPHLQFLQAASDPRYPKRLRPEACSQYA